jgi:hypothetical protein
MRVTPGGFSGTGSSSPITVSGLTNGTTYAFSLAAVNSYGFSPYSGTVSAAPGLFVEDVFSTWLYTGTGAAQTITNEINLSGKGGLVWIKNRSTTADHGLWDTVRGSSQRLRSNTTGAQGSEPSQVTGFTSSGFSLGADGSSNSPSFNGSTFASWTFRESPSFFDVVTYTGNGNASQTISHNLGVEPGCIIVKRLDATSDWSVYHRGNPSPNSSVLALNTTAAKSTYGSIAIWNPTSTTFTADRDYGNTNSGGGTYVAYLYAHDTSSTGIIQCGTYTGNTAGGATVSLGWEPQWMLIKNVNTGGYNWNVIDNMRAFQTGGGIRSLYPNTSGAEDNFTAQSYIGPTATGFSLGTSSDAGINATGQTYIYVAIRRGPMKTPTLGTSVFAPIARTGTGSQFVSTTNFPIDSIWFGARSQARGALFIDRLRGFGQYLLPRTSDPEGTNAQYVTAMGNTGFTSGNDLYFNDTGQTYVNWAFRRAPGFFDQVCYTSDGQLFAVSNHNLGVQPELIIVKRRNNTGNWAALAKTGSVNWVNGNGGGGFIVNSTAATIQTADYGPYFTSTTAQFGFVGGGSEGMQVAGGTYVAYLFASAPGVSKVGSYTGNGSSQTINCGFTAGARFFLVKRTSATGDWWVWDSARGITAPADPALALNNAAVEVTSTDSVDPTGVGIIVNQDATTNINVNGATYIFLAIA